MSRKLYHSEEERKAAQRGYYAKWKAAKLSSGTCLTCDKPSQDAMQMCRACRALGKTKPLQRDKLISD